MSNSFEQEQYAPEITSIAMLAEGMVLRLPGATDIEIRKALQEAYVDFCRLSSCFTFRREIELEKDERDYPVPTHVPGAYVDSITEVRIGGRKLVAPFDYEIEVGSTPIIRVAERHIIDFITEHDRASRPEFHAISRKPRMMHVTAIDIPKPGSERAPRWFYAKYGEAVVAGAFVKLFGMTGKPWSDGVQAQHELVRWENALTEARVRSAYAPDGGSGSGAISALDTSGLL